MSNNIALLAALLLFPGGLFAFAFGLALKGVDRRVAARLQGRVGPPLLQPFFDLVKLGFKRTMVPETTASETVFIAAPLVGVVAMFLAAVLIPIAGVYAPDPRVGNLIVLLYLLSVPGTVLMVAGSVSGSPYGAIGFSREMAMMVAYEATIIFIAVAVAMRTGMAEGHWVTFSLADIVRHQQEHGAFVFDPVMWPALVAFALFYPANLGIVPFDIPEAETEVLEGPLLEYSGVALAFFKVMSALKAVVVLGLGIALFLPVPLSGPGAAAAWLLEMAVFMVVGVTAVRVAVGRMRIDQAFFFFLKWPLLLSIASVVTVVVVGEITEMSIFPNLKTIATRSPWLYRLNAGSCNGCDVELATTALIPRYDVERLGIQYCGSPRHADIVLITGPLTSRVKDAVLRVWEEIPDPKVTVVFGVCPISGGIFRESYAVHAPVDQFIPVDVNVPGCPPRPSAIIEGIAKAIGIWRERL